jgi:hypothetical protein
MSFTPFIMTPSGPRVIFPLERIVNKENVKKEDVKSTPELEAKLLSHIDEKFEAINRKINEIRPSGAEINVAQLETRIKQTIRDEFKEYLSSDYIKKGDYDTDKKRLEGLIESKYRELLQNLTQQIKAAGIRASAEGERLAQEQAAARAERAAARQQAAEEERQRQATEAAAEAERQKQAAEAAALAASQQAETERRRYIASQQQAAAEEAERQKQAAEAAAEAERQKQAAEAAAEAARQQAAEEAAAEAERQRLAAEAASQQAATDAAAAQQVATDAAAEEERIRLENEQKAQQKAEIDRQIEELRVKNKTTLETLEQEFQAIKTAESIRDNEEQTRLTEQERTESAIPGADRAKIAQKIAELREESTRTKKINIAKARKERGLKTKNLNDNLELEINKLTQTIATSRKYMMTGGGIYSQTSEEYKLNNVLSDTTEQFMEYRNPYLENKVNKLRKYFNHKIRKLLL